MGKSVKKYSASHCAKKKDNTAKKLPGDYSRFPCTSFSTVSNLFSNKNGECFSRYCRLANELISFQQIFKRHMF
jgi:hypothetical protein